MASVNMASFNSLDTSCLGCLTALSLGAATGTGAGAALASGILLKICASSGVAWPYSCCST